MEETSLKVRSDLTQKAIRASSVSERGNTGYVQGTSLRGREKEGNFDEEEGPGVVGGPICKVFGLLVGTGEVREVRGLAGKWFRQKKRDASKSSGR